MRARVRKTATKSASSNKAAKAANGDGTPKRGRPPGRDPNRRTQIITIRVTVEEKAFLREFAETRGVEISTWMRQTMLDIADRGFQADAKNSGGKLATSPGYTIGEHDDELYVVHCAKHPGL